VNLLDTSVAIDHLRGVPAAVRLLTRVIDEAEPLVASEIVRFELLAGVREQELPAVEQFCDAISWVPVDESVVRTAGSLAREHRRAYRDIDDADYLIAATSLILGAELLTLNIRHFPMLVGLRAAY
jgi:predicted nucleic acid-binding protein